MIMQRQRSGDASTNIQIGELTVGGVSYAEARQIAVDAMRSELSALTASAEQAAMQRIIDYADRLVARLQDRPELLPKFTEPRTQISVRDAHHLHAKRGTDDVADLSIDMLIDFIACRGDDFKAVVLDDAIKATHSLTAGQIDSLTILLIVRQYKIVADDPLSWSQEMSDLVAPFLASATRSSSQLEYLVGIGCADFEVINDTFGHLFNRRYVGVSAKLSENFDPMLRQKLSFKSHQNKLRAGDPLEKILKDYSTEVSCLITYFNETKLRRMNPRVVGKAIGAANLRRKLPALVMNDDLWFEP
jgi:hypothetical protein